MKENVLLVNICKEKLHFHEFVKPVGDILVRNCVKGFIRHYTCLTKKDLARASRVIICGTSLFDNEFVKHVDKFRWLADFDRPVLGICGGMQIIGLVFGGKLLKKKEVGYYREVFRQEFLGLRGEAEVYHLHKNYVKIPKEFLKFTDSKIVQAFRHKDKKIYGVLFHPEVRQKEMILEFCEL